MSFWSWLGGALKTAWTFLTSPAPPAPLPSTATGGVVAPTGDALTNRLAQFIASKNYYLVTKAGGLIHKTTPEQNLATATALIPAAKGAGIPLALLTGYAIQESLGDPLAYDRNIALAKPNDTPHDVFLRTDLGLLQINGSTIADLPEFATATVAEMEAKGYDPVWSANWAAKTIAGNLEWATQQIVDDPSLAVKIPKGPLLNGVAIDSAWTLGAQAYNNGRKGALHIAHVTVMVNGEPMVPEPVLDGAGKPVLDTNGQPKTRLVPANWKYAQDVLGSYVAFIPEVGA